MSPAAVADEMARVVRQYGIRDFHIVDDIFNHGRGRVEAFSRELAARRLDVRFAFPNGLRGDLLTVAEVDALASAGLYFASLAIETVSPRLQRMIRKNLDVDRVLGIVPHLVRASVLARAFVMLGFPTETREEMDRTVERVVGSDFHLAMFFAVTPYPGTDLFDVAVEHGFDPRRWVEDRFTYDRDFVNTSTVPDEEFGQILREARHRFYTRPERLGRLLGWLDDNSLRDHPYILSSSMWRMVLESETGGVWSPRRGPASCPPPLAGVGAGLVLPDGWTVASVMESGGVHVVGLASGTRTCTLHVAARDESRACMLRTRGWDLSLVSEEPLSSLPSDLEEAIRSLARIIDSA
jgi:hypothetical protein